MEHSVGGAIRPVYSLKTVVLVVLRLAAFTYGTKDPCPEGFESYPGDLCYKVLIGRKDWLSAKQICSALDARVVDPRNEKENTVLKGIVSPLKAEPWLGGEKMDFGVWQWNSDKRPMSWTNWAPGFPSQEYIQKIPNREYQDCLYMTLDGTWKSQYCAYEKRDKRQNVICEVEKAGVKDKTAGEQTTEQQKTGERKTGESDNTVEENTTAGNSTNNSSDKLSLPSFLLSVCLSTVAMMKVF